ncbi:MAG: VanZ family protein [Oscillospiraceae bacterium]|nr:VanZ family protein [Oscillospiraceae bacterium]
MLMPLGFMTPEVFTKFRRLNRIILAAIAFSVFIEVTQLITGTCQMDDIMNNTLGAVIG